MKRCIVLAVSIVAAGCPGGGGHQDPDGRPADAALPPDAPIATSPLVADGGSGPVAAWTFADTAAGAKAQATLLIRNGGAGSIGPLALTITGDPDFSIVASGSTCEGQTLAAGDQCQVRLAFAPTATGARDAILHVAAGAATPLDLPLHGKGLPALPAGLVADVSALDFASVEIQQHADASVLLSNTSTAAITLGARKTTPGYTIASDNCPASLSPGGACTVTVRFTPTISGLLAGTLTAPWSGGDVGVALSGIGLRRITITRIGGGAGHVVSSPSGLDCGTTCSALFAGAVTLTATPDAQDRFAGWDALCGTATTCTLPAAGGSISLTARFETSAAKQIAVTFAGGARGIVYVVDEVSLNTLLICNASCSTYVSPGAQIGLYGFTPSTFGGWTGACTAATHDCNLGTIINDRAVTVTFTPDEREVTTLFPDLPVGALGFAPGGDLIVGDAGGVVRLTQAGAQVWRASSVGAVGNLATDAAGDVFALGGGGLWKLDPTGAVVWTRPITGGRGSYESIESAVAASPDGTVIAVLAPGGARVVDGAGNDRFTIANLTDVRGVAVAPDGTVAIASESAIDPDEADVHRYTSAGVALATLSPLPGYYDAALAYDAQGYLVAHATGHSRATVSRTAPDLKAAFSSTDTTTAPANLAGAIAVASTGDVIAYRADSDFSQITGLNLQVFSPAGTRTWTHIKKYSMWNSPIVDDGVWPRALAADGAKHIAVGGTYGYDQPWIQIYALP
jgi:hypothetical protein